MQTLNLIKKTKKRTYWLLTGLLHGPVIALVLLLCLVPDFAHRINVTGYFGAGQSIGLIMFFVIPVTLSQSGVDLAIAALLFSFLPPIPRRFAVIVAVAAASEIALVDLLNLYGKVEYFKMDWVWLIASSFSFMAVLLVSAVIAPRIAR